MSLSYTEEQKRLVCKGTSKGSPVLERRTIPWQPPNGWESYIICTVCNGTIIVHVYGGAGGTYVTPPHLNTEAFNVEPWD